VTRVVLMVTSPRVAAGTLSWPAWSLLREGIVLTADAEHPQLDALEAAGIPVEVLDESGPAEAARRLLEAATDTGTAVWLAGPGGDEEVGRALGQAATRAADEGRQVELELVHGSWDVPGARLLDVVATMDRLRSPGGCPWDAKQTHDSLAPYLLEEAYEAFQAIEDEDQDALREELGDVLLQIAFHARMAEEHEGEARWSIDDVAAGLVDKLVRRHPHVFGDREVSDADEVVTNWEAIKAAEKGRPSAVEGVALAQPALTLAATLQRKAMRLGLPVELVAPEFAAGSPAAAAIGAAAAAFDESPDVETAGALLWTVVAALHGVEVDAEAALRGRARRFRDRLAEVEADLHEAGVDPHTLSAEQWHERFGVSAPR
jgi:XTP/dITP diphosphohydrolase